MCVLMSNTGRDLTDQRDRVLDQRAGVRAVRVQLHRRHDARIDHGRRVAVGFTVHQHQPQPRGFGLAGRPLHRERALRPLVDADDNPITAPLFIHR